MDETTTANDLVVWSDPHLVVVSKPAGLLSLPDGYDQSQPHLQRLLEPEFGRLWIVHRLDRETSGVIILARTAEAHHLLNDEFAGRQVRKTYHALITAVPEWTEIEAAFPLRKNGDRKHRTVIDPRNGKPASTSLSILEKHPAGCLVEARPHTGYTHQIRAHLAHLGCPIAGDPLYGGVTGLFRLASGLLSTDPTSGQPVLTRVALHALQIEFTHPITHQACHFEIPYPKDFETATALLRQQS